MVAGVLVGDKRTVDTAGTPSRGHLHYASPQKRFHSDAGTHHDMR
jgi:hypothetical protein